jgi:hypothetical protein
MQIVYAGSLLPPNVCFLCEEAKQEGSVLVDTFRVHLEDYTHLPLSGRKYVCEGCVREMARLLELVSSSDTVSANSRADAYEAALRALRYKLELFVKELASIQAQPLSNLIEIAPVDQPLIPEPEKAKSVSAKPKA